MLLLKPRKRWGEKKYTEDLINAEETIGEGKVGMIFYSVDELVGCYSIYGHKMGFENIIIFS